MRVPRLFQRRKPDGRWNRVVVIFTRPARDVARLDIAIGPCIAPPGRKRPLVGVTNQEPGDESRYETLFQIMVEEGAAGPWESTASSGEGRLHVFSDAFVEALAEVNREEIRRGEARPQDYDWMFAPGLALAEQWLAAIRYPFPDATPWGVASTELGNACGWARVAQERGQKLYCWSGPGFDPWVTSERVERLAARLTRRR